MDAAGRCDKLLGNAATHRNGGPPALVYTREAPASYSTTYLKAMHAFARIERWFPLYMGPRHICNCFGKSWKTSPLSATKKALMGLGLQSQTSELLLITPQHYMRQGKLC